MDWDPEEEAQAAFGAFSRETLPAASAGGGGGAAAASGSGASAGGPASGGIDTGAGPSGIDSRAEERAKASARPMPSMTAENTKGVMLLLVFIHGFKGSAETTFEDFPSRMAHILSATYPSLRVETVVYPTYDTRGTLTVAVDNFVEWLISRCVQLESKPLLDEKTGAVRDPAETGRGGGAGSVKIILCGHSMGGIVAADAVLNIAREGGWKEGKLWPRITSVLAFDSPYLGVHPGVFKNSIDKYQGYVKTATDVGAVLAPLGAALGASFGFGQASRSSERTTPTSAGSGNRSPWFWAASAATAALAGAAGAGIYATRGTLGQSYTWVSDHLSFVGNLWDQKGNEKRLEDIATLPQVLFHCYYTRLSSRRSRAPGRERTFCILPSATSRAAASFTPAPNMLATDEVEAHISMFNPNANDDYYRMGQEAARLVGKSLFEELQVRGGSQKKAQKEADEAPDQAQGSRAGDPELLQEQEEQKKQLQEEANQAAEEADRRQEERDREMERRKAAGTMAATNGQSHSSRASIAPPPPDDEPSPWL